MNNLLSAADIKEQVSLVDLLSRLGHEPVRQTGKELLYLSMLRESDTKPSFAVNEQLNVWYDHGIGKGGNVVDFGVAYWPLTSFIDVLHKIKATVAQEIIPNHPVRSATARQRLPVRIPHYEVEEIKAMGNNPAISNYINSRGISELAQEKLSEVYYYVEDQKKLKKHFFAAGWQNELGGWEVRNKYFKGCLGHKAISLVPGGNDRLLVFEGYLDYLSWLTEHEEANPSVLILNSLSLLEVAIRRAKDFSDVELYFDRDKSGLEATIQFIATIPYARDASPIYEGFIDYNERLMTGLGKKTDLSFLPGENLGTRNSIVR